MLKAKQRFKNHFCHRYVVKSVNFKEIVVVDKLEKRYKAWPQTLEKNPENIKKIGFVEQFVQRYRDKEDRVYCCFYGWVDPIFIKIGEKNPKDSGFSDDEWRDCCIKFGFMAGDQVYSWYANKKQYDAKITRFEATWPKDFLQTVHRRMDEMINYWDKHKMILRSREGYEPPQVVDGKYKKGSCYTYTLQNQLEKRLRKHKNGVLVKIHINYVRPNEEEQNRRLQQEQLQQMQQEERQAGILPNMSEEERAEKLELYNLSFGQELDKSDEVYVPDHNQTHVQPFKQDFPCMHPMMRRFLQQNIQGWDVNGKNGKNIKVGRTETVGKIVHSLINIDKFSRLNSKLFGQDVVEIDLKSHHPHLISQHPEHFFSKCIVGQGELRIWNEMIASGDFYAALLERLKNFDKRSRYALKNTTRDQFKIIFQKILVANCPYWARTIRYALKHFLPSFYDTNIEKRQNNHYFQRRLQRIEAGKVDKLVMYAIKKGVPLIPFYDSFVARECDADVIRGFLWAETTKTLKVRNGSLYVADGVGDFENKGVATESLSKKIENKDGQSVTLLQRISNTAMDVQDVVYDVAEETKSFVESKIQQASETIQQIEEEVCRGFDCVMETLIQRDFNSGHYWRNRKTYFAEVKREKMNRKADVAFFNLSVVRHR